ncbi:MAG: endonuclease III domain-containing protein [Bacteroidota bacterium]
MKISPGDLTRLRRLLLAEHGRIEDWSEDFPLHAAASDPLAALIATVLSQATNDRNSSRAFADLCRTFLTWSEVLSAPEAAVAAAIARGGLGSQKAKTIQAILARLLADRGSLALDFLASMPPGEARAYLLSLPGVGPKTAACVQLFSLGQKAFPVDTHVHRVARRLGLVPQKADAAKTQALLEEMIAPEECLPLHLLLIQHGRRFCRPAKPRCGECPLRKDCPASESAQQER